MDVFLFFCSSLSDLESKIGYPDCILSTSVLPAFVVASFLCGVVGVNRRYVRLMKD